MNKIKLLVASMFVGLALVSYAKAGSGDVEGKNAFSCTSSSQVSSVNGTVLWSVALATGNNTDYVAVFDTIALVGGNVGAFTKDQRLTPNIVFSSTVLSGINPVVLDLSGFGGVRAKKGLYLFQSNTVNQATVYYK